MSFNKKYLPNKEELITILLENGSDMFYIGYVKTADVYIGSDEAIEFIDLFVNKLKVTNEEFFSLG